MTRSYYSSRSIATLFCLPFLLYASSDTKILFNMKRIVASEVKRYASTSTSKDIQRFSLCRFVLVFYCSVIIDDVQKHLWHFGLAFNQVFTASRTCLFIAVKVSGLSRRQTTTSLNCKLVRILHTKLVVQSLHRGAAHCCVLMVIVV